VKFVSINFGHNIPSKINEKCLGRELNLNEGCGYDGAG
jgi:hypothetical protein